MYKWRLLLFASFAVFQPIASLTERNLVDGRCCDRLPYSLHRDTKLAVYGTYRANKFAENPRLNTYREISQNRRDEIKDLDTVSIQSVERRVSQQREQSRVFQDRQARITSVEGRRIGTFNIRETRERPSPDDRDRASLYRLSHDEISTRPSNERRFRVSIDSDRRVERMRDNTHNPRNEIREAQNLHESARNGVFRQRVTNTHDGRRVAREVDLDNYLSRADMRREINKRDRYFVDQRVREVDQYRYRISSPSRSHIVETREMYDNNGNQLVLRESRNNERRLTSSGSEMSRQVGDLNRRSFDRDTNQVSRHIHSTDNFGSQYYSNTRLELRGKPDDERRFVKGDNRRLVRNTNDHQMAANGYQIVDERRVIDQRRKDSTTSRINQNRERDNELKNNNRHGRRSHSEIDRRLERNVMGVERRVASRSLDRRDSLVVRSRRDTSIRRIRDESRNNAKDERQIVSHTMRRTARLLDDDRHSMSRRANIVNKIRERQSLERLTTSTNEYRRTVTDSRESAGDYRNIDLNDRRIARERVDFQRRISIFPSLLNSRETRYAQQRLTRRAGHSRRSSDSRVIELIQQLHREETRSNLSEERRSINRMTFDKFPAEIEVERRNTRVSINRASTARREMRTQARTQRSTDNVRLVDVRRRLEIDANVREQRVGNSEQSRAMPETHLTESRVSKEVDLAHTRDSRLNQRSRYQTFQARDAILNRSKQEDTDRIIIGSRSHLRLLESTQKRNTFVVTSEKEPLFTPFVLDWQYVFYTLQGIYIFGILVQMLNDCGSANGKPKSFRRWGASTRSAIKID